MMKEFGKSERERRKRRRRRKKGEQFTTEITERCNEEQRQRTKGAHQGEPDVLHGWDEEAPSERFKAGVTLSRTLFSFK